MALREHIEKLNLLIAVSRCDSFHEAAKRVGMAQPSISHSIRLLEQSVGFPLFYRSKKGIKLTDAGKELVGFSERLLSEVDGIEQRIRGPREAMTGSLKVGTYASFLTYLWPKFLAQLSKKYGALVLQLATIKPHEVSQALESRRCHFVVSTEKIILADAVHVELYRDSYGFFVSRKLIELHRRSDSSLEELPFIYVPNAKDAKGRTLESLLYKSEFTDAKNYQLDSFDAVKALTQEGLGVGVLPERILSGQQDEKLFERIHLKDQKKSFGSHQVYVTYLASDRTDPRISKSIQELKEWCLKI